MAWNTRAWRGGQGVDIGGIAAADHSHEGNATPACFSDDVAIPCGEARIGEGQSPEPVVHVRIDPGIVEHDVRREAVEEARQMRRQNGRVGRVVDAIYEAQIEVAGDLARRVVLLRMDREREQVR